MRPAQKIDPYADYECVLRGLSHDFGELPDALRELVATTMQANQVDCEPLRLAPSTKSKLIECWPETKDALDRLEADAYARDQVSLFLLMHDAKQSPGFEERAKLTWPDGKQHEAEEHLAWREALASRLVLRAQRQLLAEVPLRTLVQVGSLEKRLGAIEARALIGQFRTIEAEQYNIFMVGGAILGAIVASLLALLGDYTWQWALGAFSIGSFVGGWVGVLWCMADRRKVARDWWSVERKLERQALGN